MKNPTLKKIRIHDVIGGASPDYTIFGLVNENAFGGKAEKLLRSPKGRSTKDMCDFFEARYQHDYAIVLKEFKKIDSKIFEQNCYFRDQMFRLRHSFELELSNIYNSKSWKITAPLRSVANRFRVVKKITSNALVSLKNNSMRDFFLQYMRKSVGGFCGDIGRYGKKNGIKEAQKKAFFFEKYKRMLNKARKKK